VVVVVFDALAVPVTLFAGDPHADMRTLAVIASASYGRAARFSRQLTHPFPGSR
jgi:hypothetical protein